MAYDTKTRTRLIIEKATESGFIVLESGRAGDFCPVLCAGSLQRCLNYIETQAWPADVWTPGSIEQAA